VGGVAHESFTRPRLLTTAPPSVIDLVASALRGPISREEPAAAGFTESVASVVSAASGARVFVKAAPSGHNTGDAVRAGAELASLTGDLGPPLVSFVESDGWVCAVYKVVPGDAVSEWTAADLPQLTALSHRLRERLDPSPLPHTEPYATAFDPLLGAWSALENPHSASASTVAHVRDRELPYGLSVGMLAELEAQWHPTLTAGTALQHGDIRRDNVVREPSGRLWLVDWTHRWTAPGWADWVRLAPDVAASGFDAESFLLASAWPDADAHAVDVMLAGLAGRCWRDGHLPGVAGLPQLRPMQLLQGDMTLRWLARRTRRSS
jgi:hypothetical protein